MPKLNNTMIYLIGIPAVPKLMTAAIRRSMVTASRSLSCIVLALLLFTSCWVAQFPPQSRKPIMRLPFEANDHGIIFLKARVNRSRWMSFALDSGASFPFVIDSRRARELKLRLGNNRTLSAGGGPGSYEVSDTLGITIELGDLRFSNRSAKVLSLDSLESIAGHRLDGLVGQELFRDYVVEINYADRVLNLYGPQAFTYSGTGEILPLTAEEHYFSISAMLGMTGHSPIVAKLLVDTGGGFVTFVLNEPFARSKRLPTPDQKSILDRSLAGLGGEMRLLVSRGPSLLLGSLIIPDPIVYISQDTGGALASSDFDGVLGSQILQKFKVIFDLPHGRLILEPNASYEQPLQYDMSGIRLHAGGPDLKELRVYQVLENSPAATAGLAEGDVITEIDDVSVSKLSLSDVYEIFKQKGRTVKLDVRRNGKVLSATIRLETLI